MECRVEEKTSTKNHVMQIGRVLWGEFEKLPKNIKSELNVVLEVNGMLVSLRPITENDKLDTIILIDKKQEVISKRLDNLLGLG